MWGDFPLRVPLDVLVMILSGYLWVYMVQIMTMTREILMLFDIRVRLGDTRRSPAMMSDFIFEWGLMDIPLVGGKFTWSSNHENQCWSRIVGFFFLLIGKNSFLMLFKGEFLDFCVIIFH
jgi:hypothetical protein